MAEQFGNFQGFRQETILFLKEIAGNNNKTWFEAHKQDYQQYVLRPFQDLVADLTPFMLIMDPEFTTTPKVGKTISRIYRDTRFSKDKSLYRNSVWFTFKRNSPDWKEDPAFFFEINPTIYRYGMGFYQAPRPFIEFFRKKITSEPQYFLDAVSFLKQDKSFTLEGEEYKKIPVHHDHPEIERWCRLKSFCLICNNFINSSDPLLFTKDLTDRLINDFEILVPLYHYLWDIKRLISTPTI